VDVVWHQAIAPHSHRGLAHLLGQDVAVDVLIPVFKEDRLAPGATRRDGVGAIRERRYGRSEPCQDRGTDRNKKRILLLSSYSPASAPTRCCWAEAALACAAMAGYATLAWWWKPAGVGAAVGTAAT
jgi:hypothetical protein